MPIVNYYYGHPAANPLIRAGEEERMISTNKPRDRQPVDSGKRVFVHTSQKREPKPARPAPTYVEVFKRPTNPFASGKMLTTANAGDITEKATRKRKTLEVLAERKRVREAALAKAADVSGAAPGAPGDEAGAAEEAETEEKGSKKGGGRGSRR